MSDGFHSPRILDTRAETRQAGTVSFDVPRLCAKPSDGGRVSTSLCDS